MNEVKSEQQKLPKEVSSKYEREAFQFAKDLGEELVRMKEERRYHNKIRCDHLQPGVQVPAWQLNERLEIMKCINDYRRDRSWPEITENAVLSALRLAKASNSNPLKAFVDLAKLP